MASEPLADYFEFGGARPQFLVQSSALWRGYVGTWEIRDNRLYLIGITAKLADDSEANLESVFPGYPERVFAHWYSGEIRLPQGELLEYVHMGFGSRYHADIILRLERGRLVSNELRTNDPTDAAVKEAKALKTPLAHLKFGGSRVTERGLSGQRPTASGIFWQ